MFSLCFPPIVCHYSLPNNVRFLTPFTSYLHAFGMMLYNLPAVTLTYFRLVQKTGHRRLESTHAYNRCSSPSCTPAPCAGSCDGQGQAQSLTGRPAVHTDTLIRVRLMLMDAPAQISTSTSPTLILIWHFPLRLDIDGHIDSHDFAMSLTCRLSPD